VLGFEVNRVVPESEVGIGRRFLVSLIWNYYRECINFLGAVANFSTI
jgi:hypothetical protein